jgi:hypothetical protein
MNKNIEILIISISKPLKIGLYENRKLFETIESQEYTSDILPIIFEKLLEKYKIENIYFINGPGSYMSIKIIYIFLKTLNISRNINLQAIDGFAFTNQPIKSIGNRYFIKTGEKIETIVSNEKIDTKFELPKELNVSIFSNDIEPKYIIPAV